MCVNSLQTLASTNTRWRPWMDQNCPIGWRFRIGRSSMWVTEWSYVIQKTEWPIPIRLISCALHSSKSVLQNYTDSAFSRDSLEWKVFDSLPRRSHSYQNWHEPFCGSRRHVAKTPFLSLTIIAWLISWNWVTWISRLRAKQKRRIFVSNRLQKRVPYTTQDRLKLSTSIKINKAYTSRNRQASYGIYNYSCRR